MIYGDVCSGISAPTVAWAPLGWRAAFYSEIDKFPRAVLKHHYPDTPLAGDFTQIEDGDHEPIDLLVGGTPCQSFSVAGKRLGLDDPRGNLAIEFARLAQRLRPRWVVFENVPGLLSNFSGSEQTEREVRMGLGGERADGEEDRDFAAFLSTIRECRYLGCWRRFDAQYAGVPQRRDRLFFVGYLGDWRPPAAVLLEPESLRGDPPPRRGAGQGVAGSLDASAGGSDENDARDGRLIAQPNAPPLTSNPYGDHESRESLLVAYGGNRTSGPTESETFVVPVQCNGSNIGTDLPSLRRGDGGLTSGVPAIAFHARQDPDSGPVAFQHKASAHQSMNPGPISPTLEVEKSDGVAVAFSCKDHGADAGAVSPPLRALNHDKSHANAGGQVAIIEPSMRVRRITPREAERLQGFPDDFTLIPWRGKPAEDCPDGPRYRALGNSMAVPVVRWIGARIQAFEDAAS